MRNIKKVIAVRHGEYDEDTESLTKKGEIQSKVLAEAIRSAISGNDRVLILTSPEIRAFETAHIIGNHFDTFQLVKCEFLYYDEYEEGIENSDKVKGVVDDEFHVIIMVTHGYAPSGIIHGFSKERFKKHYDREMLLTGQGLVLCLSSGQITRLP